MKYSGMYEFLVADNYDFVGKMAYVFYKEHKREVINKKQIEAKIDEVPEEFIEAFVYSQKTENAKEGYRKQAQEYLQEFARRANTEKYSDLEKEYTREYRKLMRVNSWWYGVSQSLAASFIFVLLGALVLKYSGTWDILVNKLF